PSRPLPLRMALMADEDDVEALLGIALSLAVHLRDQRAGGVDHRQVPQPRLVGHLLRHAMGAEHGDGALGDLVQLVDEAGPDAAQLLDHALVVHDLMTDIDRRAILLDRELDNLHGTLDAGAESSGLRKYHQHARPTFPLIVTEAPPHSLPAVTIHAQANRPETTRSQ